MISKATDTTISLIQVSMLIISSAQRIII